VIRRVIQRFVREETGIALVMALAMVTIFAILTAAVLMAGTANVSESVVSDQQREAFAIAQQGLAYAEGMVYYDTANAIAVPTGTFAQPTQPVGSGTYAYALSGGTMSMIGTGTVGNVTKTVKAQASPALNVEVILDTSQSMTNSCASSVTGINSPYTPQKIDCAKAGVQALLLGLWPCYSTLSSCGASTANSGELGANVANPVDEVGLLAFPALSSTASRPYEIDCNSSDSFAVTYPNPPTGSQPGYDVVGLSSDYRSSDTGALNTTTSNLVEAIDWGQCPGAAGTYSGSSGGTSTSMPSGTRYYTLNSSSSPSTTNTANTITLSQSQTLTGLTFDTSGTSSGLTYTATVGVVSGSSWTATAMTCTSSGGNPCTFSGSVSEPAGTMLNIQVVSSGSGSTRSGTWSVTYNAPGGVYPGGNYYGLKVIGGQGSYLAGAITEAQYVLDNSGRAGAVNVIIVLSDGALNSPHSWVDNTPCNTANNAATTAKSDGILIYSIGYDTSGGSCTDTSGTFHGASGATLMQSIASSSSTFFNQPTAGDLTTTFTHIAGDLGRLRFIG
jgi:Tfp pilus assembly protein PilX